MDLRQLTYFTAIAQEGSITAAARRLHMAQPPLSQSLMGLERELGVRLLERGPRRVTLTEAGKLLYERSQQLLELAHSTQQELEDLGQGLQGTLRIGTVSSSGAALVTPRLVAFCQRHPRIRFDIQEGNTYELMDLLQTGLIEAAVVRTPFPSEGVGVLALEPEPMVAVMGQEQHEGEESLILAQLAGRPLVIYKRFQTLLQDTFASEGLTPAFFCLAEDARTVLQWVKAGLGTGIVPRSAFELVGKEGLAALPIDHPQLVTNIAVIWMKERYLSAIARQFLEMFTEEE